MREEELATLGEELLRMDFLGRVFSFAGLVDADLGCPSQISGSGEKRIFLDDSEEASRKL